MLKPLLWTAAVAAAFTNAACTSGQENPSVGTSAWQLTTIGGQPVLRYSAAFSHLPAPFLVIRQDGTGPIALHGFGGCNTFSGTIDARQPTAESSVEATEQHCGEDIAVQEMTLFRILSNYPRFDFSRSAETIRITSKDGTRLTGSRTSVLAVP
ncbi:MAG: META domain-containing protein [Rhodobacteraceae bacterium]|nr:META domain-containing protein [Paracoccaceae bacterium]